MEGNQMKMREALLEARRFVWASAQRTDRDLLVTDDEKRGPYGPYVLSPKDTLAKIDAALAAPPRNCDVGTAEEQAKRFSFFCMRYHGCGKCDLNKRRKDCKFSWGQMPYEAQEGAGE